VTKKSQRGTKPDMRLRLPGWAGLWNPFSGVVLWNTAAELIGTGTPGLARTLVGVEPTSSDERFSSGSDDTGRTAFTLAMRVAATG